jgi:DNA-binding GntR family transcriptional regulator
MKADPARCANPALLRRGALAAQGTARGYTRQSPMEILRAIERREPTEARHAMQVHVDASRDKMVKLFSA